MSTEVWFRNPHDYIRELVEVGECKIAWDRGLLVKKRIDLVKHAELYFANAFDYRILAVGTQGTAEYRPGDKLDSPSAVYPTWAYGEDSVLLEDMLANPMGEDEVSCNDQNVRDDERPVMGQEHRVVIVDIPNVSTGPGRAFMRYLKGLQEEYPEAIIHIHGLYSYKHCFGMGFGAADFEPRTSAQKGNVHTPSGKIEKYERMVQKPQWAQAMGFKPNDLAIPRNRCMYNIKSAVWAGAYYEEMFKFKSQGEGSGDYESPANEHVPAEAAHVSKGVKAVEGDKMLCDTCSLQDKCKYYRSGAVCTVPGAEPVALSRFFKTRSADDIIDGLGTILAAGASRLERGLDYERVEGGIDPEVSKQMGQVFDQGVKLAKLLEPGRFSGGAKVQVNVGAGGAAAIQTGNPRQLVAAAIRELEQQGVPRDKITSEMIQGVFEGMQNPDAQPKAIQGTVTEVRDEPPEEA